METGHMGEIVHGLQSDHEQGVSPGWRLCHACVDLVGVSGAGILLVDAEGNGSSLGHSDDATRVVEDLQFTLGEGPGIDAHALGHPVLEPRLEDLVGVRWPAFGPAAVRAGFLAAFSFPLSVGAMRVGSLDLYHERPGDLDHTQLGDAIAMSDLATRTVIAVQAGADPGELAREMGSAHDLRTQVHQAAGMVSNRLGISIGDALLRIRAHAYAEGQPIHEVARDVVARRLRLD